MGMPPGPRPYAVTVNWNRAEDTIECVSSLIQGSPTTKIIVVDNGSEDGSVAILRQTIPGLEVLENSENQGYAKGINHGIMRALEMGATHVLLINNDAVTRPGMVETLLQALERHPHAGIVGPKIFYYGTDVMWFKGGRFNHLLGFSRHPFMDRKDDGNRQDREVDFITGCVMMVRAEVFSDIGLFDEDFEMYVEDLDFCLRAMERGYRSFLIPSAMAEHKVSVSTGLSGSNLMTPYRAYYYGRNMAMMVYKRKRGLALITCFLGQTVILLPYYFMLMNLEGSKGSFKHYVRGYVQALKQMVRPQDRVK